MFREFRFQWNFRRLYSQYPESRARACRKLVRFHDDRALEPIRNCLGDAYPTVRAAACRSLGKMGDSNAIDGIMRCLKDEYWYVREVASKALGQLGDSRAVGSIITLLGDEIRSVRNAATEALKELGEIRLAKAFAGSLKGRKKAFFELSLLANAGDSRAFNPLLKLSGNKDWHVRRAACSALGHFGDTQAVNPLINALGDGSILVRKAACNALEKLGEGRLARTVFDGLKGDKQALEEIQNLSKEGDFRALEPLLQRLEDIDWNIRKWACESLGQLGDTRAVKPLIDYIGDRKPEIRRAVCKALGKLGDMHALNPLLGSLGDSEWPVRESACEALGKLRSPEAVSYLVRHLVDVDHHVVDSAIKALVDIGKASVNPLISALGDHNYSMRKAACEALVRLGEAKLAMSVFNSLRGKKKAFIDLQNLAEKGDIRAFEPLMSRLVDNNWHIRKSVCLALGYINDPRAVNPLIERLGEGYRQVRNAAGKSLKMLGEGDLAIAFLGAIKNNKRAFTELRNMALRGDVRTLNPLIQILKNGSRRTRRSAISALVKIGDPSVDILIQSLDDSNWFIRKSTCKALGRLGFARAMDPLIDKLKNAEKGMRKPAGSALKNIYRKLTPEKMFCHKDLTRFKREIAYNNRFYVCRTCGKAGDIMLIDEVIATLDDKMNEEFMAKNGIARINWLKLRKLFDFDRVEIISSRDFDVESFCTEIGNDTDNFRNTKYKKMECFVNRKNLLENTIRILKDRFGKVILNNE